MSTNRKSLSPAATNPQQSLSTEYKTHAAMRQSTAPLYNREIEDKLKEELYFLFLLAGDLNINLQEDPDFWEGLTDWPPKLLAELTRVNPTAITDLKELSRKSFSKWDKEFYKEILKLWKISQVDTIFFDSRDKKKASRENESKRVLSSSDSETNDSSDSSDDEKDIDHTGEKPALSLKDRENCIFDREKQRRNVTGKGSSVADILFNELQHFHPNKKAKMSLISDVSTYIDGFRKNHKDIYTVLKEINPNIIAEIKECFERCDIPLADQTKQDQPFVPNTRLYTQLVELCRLPDQCFRRTKAVSSTDYYDQIAALGWRPPTAIKDAVTNVVGNAPNQIDVSEAFLVRLGGYSESIYLLSWISYTVRRSTQENRASRVDPCAMQPKTKKILADRVKLPDKIKSYGEYYDHCAQYYFNLLQDEKKATPKKTLPIISKKIVDSLDLKKEIEGYNRLAEFAQHIDKEKSKKYPCHFWYAPNYELADGSFNITFLPIREMNKKLSVTTKKIKPSVPKEQWKHELFALREKNPSAAIQPTSIELVRKSLPGFLADKDELLLFVGGHTEKLQFLFWIAMLANIAKGRISKGESTIEATKIGLERTVKKELKKEEQKLFLIFKEFITHCLNPATEYKYYNLPVIPRAIYDKLKLKEDLDGTNRWFGAYLKPNAKQAILSCREWFDIVDEPTHVRISHKSLDDMRLTLGLRSARSLSQPLPISADSQTKKFNQKAAVKRKAKSKSTHAHPHESASSAAAQTSMTTTSSSSSSSSASAISRKRPLATSSTEHAPDRAAPTSVENRTKKVKPKATAESKVENQITHTPPDMTVSSAAAPTTMTRASSSSSSSSVPIISRKRALAISSTTDPISHKKLSTRTATTSTTSVTATLATANSNTQQNNVVATTTHRSVSIQTAVTSSSSRLYTAATQPKPTATNSTSSNPDQRPLFIKQDTKNKKR